MELNSIKPWIQKKITEILGFEDEVVINLAISELESKEETGPCPKRIQLNLTGNFNNKWSFLNLLINYFLQKGFLTNKASIFMKELWKLLLEAQETLNGIPPSLIQERKEEILQKNEEIMNQEAKLESIRAFLKQAGEEIKSKLNNKKGPNDDDVMEIDKSQKKFENNFFSDEKQEKEKKYKDYKKKQESHKESRPRHHSRSHSKSNQKKKKQEKRQKSKNRASKSHSKEKRERKYLEENQKKKNKHLEEKNGGDKKTKLMAFSSGSDSGGSSDESSPISQASSD